jgi:GxxExxY protein
VLFEELTRDIIGAAMEVHRVLGPGFLESVYQNALCHELQLRELKFETELEVHVGYKQLVVGRHRLDLVVENSVIVELKVASAIVEAHLAQALSYMKATGIEVSLILNFAGSSLTWKRLLKSRPPIR